jgi:hypothetical protein
MFVFDFILINLMQMRYQILAFVFSLFVLSGCKKDNWRTCEVVRNCTGVYLRFDAVEYRVCNEFKLLPFADGERVRVRYALVKGCGGTGQIVCMMFYEHDGLADVLDVEKN